MSLSLGAVQDGANCSREFSFAHTGRPDEQKYAVGPFRPQVKPRQGEREPRRDAAHGMRLPPNTL
jgi:hypothetical protein